MLDNTTIHVKVNGKEAEVGSFNQDTLEPPKEIIVAVAPGIYYSYTNPELIPDDEEDVYGKARINRELKYLMDNENISAEGQQSLELILMAFKYHWKE